MEEVIGSIPIRSTNYFNHLAPPPFRDFVANPKTLPCTRGELVSQLSVAAVCSVLVRVKFPPFEKSLRPMPPLPKVSVFTNSRGVGSIFRR